MEILITRIWIAAQRQAGHYVSGTHIFMVNLIIVSWTIPLSGLLPGYKRPPEATLTILVVVLEEDLRDTGSALFTGVAARDFLLKY